MKLTDLSPLLTYPLGLLFLVALALIALGVVCAFRFDRQIQAENDKAAAKKVKADRHPNPEEIYVPEHPVHDELDDPDPP